MIWLLVILAVLLLAAAAGHLFSTRFEAAAGLPTGKILRQDTGGNFAPSDTLISEKYGLVGRPDYVVWTNEGPVPVEIKSTPVPSCGPYENHVAQLLGYCLLVEDVMQQPVPEGILRYRDGEVRVAFSAENREWVLDIIGAMREAEAGRAVVRNHGQVNKCRACAFRPACREALG